MQTKAQKNAFNRSRVVDLKTHGTVLPSGYFAKGQWAAPLIAARWEGESGRDFIVTVPWYIPPLGEWPVQDTRSAAWRAWKRNMRQGARALSTAALRSLGRDFGYIEGSRPWLPDLHPCLESMGIIRIVPKHQRKVFEEDSFFHWCHQMRDGLYDVWAGAMVQSDGKVKWLGQDADDNNRAGFIPIQYNQLRINGHGVAFVFRFKAEAMEQLKLAG